MTLQPTDTLTLTVTETDRLGQFTILSVAMNGVYRDTLRFANEGMTPSTFLSTFAVGTVFGPIGRALTFNQRFFCTPTPDVSDINSYRICMRHADGSLWFRNQDSSRVPATPIDQLAH